MMINSKWKIVLMFCVMVMLSFRWPSKLEKKINTTVMKTFSIERFQLDPVVIDQPVEDKTILAINNHLYKVVADDIMKGYIYVGQAPSMKNVFDYAVVLSDDLEILNAKVLIYREKHGRQIGMRRWLKQFFGMEISDRPEIGIHVDGISGATISATSMTSAVSDMLSSLDYIRQSGNI